MDMPRIHSVLQFLRLFAANSDSGSRAPQTGISSGPEVNSKANVMGMKLQILTLGLALSSAELLAQGTVNFNNNISGTVVTHVYEANPVYLNWLHGNGPSDYPPGALDWSLWTPVAGSRYSAQLLAAPGADVPFSSLKPASPVTAWGAVPNAAPGPPSFQSPLEL